MNSLNSEYLFYQTNKALNLVHHAQGIRIWDKSGKEYIDGCSGAIVCNIGYGNKRIKDAVNRQADSSFFAYRLHFDNEPALKLADKLVSHRRSEQGYEKVGRRAHDNVDRNPRDAFRRGSG